MIHYDTDTCFPGQTSLDLCWTKIQENCCFHLCSCPCMEMYAMHYAAMHSLGQCRSAAAAELALSWRRPIISWKQWAAEREASHLAINFTP